MSAGIEDAISSLRRAIEERRVELKQMEDALATLEHGTGRPSVPRTTEFEHLGLTEATKRYLKEVGEPRATREIADAILQRGVPTRSRNFIATLYATLANNKTEFVRKDGLWTLKKHK